MNETMDTNIKRSVAGKGRTPRIVERNQAVGWNFAKGEELRFIINLFLIK